MCFSASASFSAGAILLAVGTLTLKAVKDKREIPLAAIPMLFAIQQLIEGAIWLTFRYEAPLLNTALTYAYSFFSHVLWPVYVPSAVLLMERERWRLRVLQVFAMAGVLVGAYLLYALLTLPVVSRATGSHVDYVSPHFFVAPTVTLYLLATALSPVFSMHAVVRVFGVLAIISFSAAYLFYATWFISVWCFFAALLSALIYLHFRFGNRKIQSTNAA